MFYAVAECKSKWLSNFEQMQFQQCMCTNDIPCNATDEQFTKCMDAAATLQDMLLLAKSMLDHAQGIDIVWQHSMVAKLDVF